MLRNIAQRVRLVYFQPNAITCIRNKNTASELKDYDIEDDTDITDDLEENRLREEEIEKKRNKSGLRPHHRNLLHNNVPYAEPLTKFHTTVKYQRKLYGLYGNASGVDPRICWPEKEDISNVQDYEKIAYPDTIQQMMEQSMQKRKEIEEQRKKRQDDIVKKFAKLEQWKKDLRDKIYKKETEARAVKERKDRLVEEVRRHFGFKIDHRDERFKEMLEQKERAEKKAMKEAKRKVKEARLIAKLQENKSDVSTEANKLPTEN